MVISLRKWLQRFKFIIMFLVLSYFAHLLFGYLSAWVEPADPYREPKGDAVKAFEPLSGTERSTFAERLKLFYWLGE